MSCVSPPVKETISRDFFFKNQFPVYFLLLYITKRFLSRKINKDTSAHRVGRLLSIFSSRRNWDSPNPSPAGECVPPPFGSGGRGTLAGERGGAYGRVPIPTRGHTLWHSLYVCTLCKLVCMRPQTGLKHPVN